ncbi:MAG: hypothetical protein M0Q91_09880 [Methanoregula sp.]|jgi:hypothetical protein|nr:hypothetical protein [Methanoregula sp.]
MKIPLKKSGFSPTLREYSLMCPARDLTSFTSDEKLDKPGRNIPVTRILIGGRLVSYTSWYHDLYCYNQYQPLKTGECSGSRTGSS